MSPAESSTNETPSQAPIAIVGMSGLFPQAGDLREFWQNILNRVDAVREVPAERWREEDFFDSDRLAADKIYSKWGGFLDPIHFDPMKWKIPPASLQSIDPIQLLSLEVADRAFEDAGYHERPFPKERTGVIFACAGMNDVGSDYAFRTMVSHHLPKMKGISQEAIENVVDQTHDLLPEWTEDSFPGILTNVIAGRIANRFDLGGPNYTVDAACAASLAALYSAVAQLRTNQVDMMLVGAADGSNNAFTYMCFAKTHALSPRGKSRPFDDSADGIALGEGIAAILIKRLDDAVRDGDKIYAVIRGIGSSSDGRNRSMTAPHPGGQILALKRAYADAGLPCETISLIEAHGTGTAVGDGTEITSLNTLYSQECSDKQFAAVGSVKSMIGHTKTCAGLASLVKTALALKHKILPPTLHVEFPNRKVDFQASAFFVNTETRPWFEELGEHPRRAGISAFGFGGTNFHVVLEESPVDLEMPNDLSPRSAELLTWNRTTKAEVVNALRQLREQMDGVPVEDFSQLAFSIRHDENHRTGICRLAIVAADTNDLLAKIEKSAHLLGERDAVNDPTGIFYSQQTPISPDSVAFLYPGQGSQAVNMLRDLAVANRWSHQIFAGANHLLADFFPKALTRYMYPPPVFTPDDLERDRGTLSQTQIAQPALGVAEVFATELLKRFGVQPGVTAGLSFGEYVALYAAGCLSQDDVLSIAAHRGRISAEVGESTTPGAMAAVNAAPNQILAAAAELGLEIELANLNAPDQTIIAGPEDIIDRAVEEFSKRGLRSKRLAVTGAFHTSMMSAAAEQLGEILGAVKFHKPHRPVYSNTLAAQFPEKPSEIRKLLQRHIAEPVLFEQQIRQMRADGVEVFVEVGPGRVLTGLVQKIFSQDAPTCLTLDATGRDGVTQLAHVLGQMFVLGLPVDLSVWYADRGMISVGVTEFLQKVLSQDQPKRTDWILTTYSARPVTPLPVRSVESREGLRAKFGKKPELSSEAADAKPVPVSPAVLSPNGSPSPVRPAAAAASNKTSTVPTRALVSTVVSNPSASVSHLSSGALPSVSAFPFARLPAIGSLPFTSSFTPRSASIMNSPNPAEHSEPLNAATAQMLVQSQALMMQLLDLQKWQQHVALRFIEAHQQLIQNCANGTAMPAISLEHLLHAETPQPAPAVAAPVVHAAPAPVARVAAAPAAVRAPATVNRVTNGATARVQTAPIAPERKVSVAPHRNGNGNGAASSPAAHTNGSTSENGHHTNGTATAKPAPTVLAAPAPAITDSNHPSVDQFRAALLKAVSERTGYPEDMLDESLPLESGLGIDSIKTVEIFSSLKEYHSFFQREGQDDEETLKEFTQLKTLGDIVSMFELQLLARQSPGAQDGKQVERYALDAVPAPASNGEKKNSPCLT